MKPIIFNTEMVKAIMDGRKTQTRRPLKFQPSRVWDTVEKFQNRWCFYNENNPDFHGYIKHEPYRTGDILFVRETWCKEQNRYFYRADAETIQLESLSGVLYEWGRADGLRWRPSLHMPKEAARIFLRVTDVRVERLQDITEEAVRKEGFRDEFVMDVFYPCGYFFSKTWNKIYSKRGYGWTSNPWVWVIKFERISTQEGSPS